MTCCCCWFPNTVCTYIRDRAVQFSIGYREREWHIGNVFTFKLIVNYIEYI